MTNEEIEIDKRINEREKDDFIFIPGTDKKAKLNEDTGDFEVIDEPLLIKEKRLYFSDNDIQIERVIKYLDSKYTFVESLTEDVRIYLSDFFESNKFIDWTYYSIFKLSKNKLILLVNLDEKVFNRKIDKPIKNTLLLWLNLNFDTGHYKLIVSDVANEITNVFFNNEPINIDNYNIVELKPSREINKMKRIFKLLETEVDLDIEFKNYYLFIRTKRKADLSDVKKLESIILKLENYLL